MIQIKDGDILDLDALPVKANAPVIKRFILEVKIYPNGNVFTSTRPMRDQANAYRAIAKSNIKKEVEEEIKTCDEEEHL